MLTGATPSGDPVTLSIFQAALVGMPLAFVGSVLLLGLYRRRVAGLMAGEGAAGPTPAAQRQRTLLFAASSSPALSAPQQVLAHALGAPRRAALVQLLAGGVTGCFVTIVNVSHARIEIFALGFCLLALTYAWPAILTAGLSAARGLRGPLLGALSFVGLLESLALLTFLRGHGEAVVFGTVITAWAWNCVVPTLFAGALVSRRVRAVGPVVFGCVAPLFFGLGLGFSLITRFPKIVFICSGLLGGGSLWIWLLPVASALLVGPPLTAVWLFVLRTAYARKWLSDDTLTTDAIWLIALVTDFIFLLDSVSITAAVLAGFLVYKLTSVLFRRLLVRAGEPRGRAPRLLYLRAFSGSSSSERSFRAIAKAWRYVGNVVMISGPDFATFMVEPHEILDFVSGRLARRFIGDPSELGTRRDLIDEGRDPDGRFRISELFCRGNAWRAVFHHLLANVDVVLADVRGLSATTPGIRFEVEQLGSHVERTRVLLLTDAKTDTRLLHAHFGGQLPALELSGRPARDTPHVLEALVHAAFGRRAGIPAPKAHQWAQPAPAARLAP